MGDVVTIAFAAVFICNNPFSFFLSFFLLLLLGDLCDDDLLFGDFGGSGLSSLPALLLLRLSRINPFPGDRFGDRNAFIPFVDLIFPRTPGDKASTGDVITASSTCFPTPLPPLDDVWLLLLLLLELLLLLLL